VNELFLKKICGMDEAAFTAHWEKLNGGDSTKPMPIWIEDNSWLVRYIDRNPGAIGFADPNQTGSLHVVLIDGKEQLE
jgi:hypothetical protein